MPKPQMNTQWDASMPKAHRRFYVNTLIADSDQRVLDLATKLGVRLGEVKNNVLFQKKVELIAKQYRAEQGYKDSK